MRTNNVRLEQTSMLKQMMAKPEEALDEGSKNRLELFARECRSNAGLNNAKPEGPPLLCLSVRQPWAWLIVNGWKNVENRTWETRVRGRIRIHASKGMTRGDYDACRLFIACQGMQVDLPDFDALERGGIVGETTILDCVTHHPSEWFTGPYGFVVDDSKPLPFVPCAGKLGFFFPKEVAP